ncbi:Hypothetical predicted protein, partial [Pelobates cultripes]
MMQKFAERGYDARILEDARLKAMVAPVQPKIDPAQRMIFPMTFHCASNLVTLVIKENWKMVATDDTLPKVFKELP